MIKRIFLFTIFLIASTYQVIAQDTSQYKSNYEEVIFTKISDSISVNPLEIMIALDYVEGNEVAIPKKIKALYEALNPEKLKTKSKKKQIKTIYAEIHSAKLKKYIIDGDFNSLFTKGEYNCVSATALYALILDEFGIDYEIRETPTHVYLIADPKGEKILIETTLPTQGTITFDYKTQKEYVLYLKSNKLISEEEFANNPIEKLFDQYYDENKIINSTQLAALLYYNKGVENYNETNYLEAAYFLDKALQIYPSTTVQFMNNYALLNVMIKSESTREFHPRYLAKFVNLNQEGTQFAALGLAHFNFVGNELLVAHPDIKAYEGFYQQFKSTIDTSKNIKDFESNYRNRLAYTFEVKRMYPEALNELNASYLINPENLEVKQSIYNVAVKHMADDKNHKENIDSLKKYMEIFDVLENDPIIQEYYNYCQMRVIRDCLSYGSINNCLNKLTVFESQLKENPKMKYSSDYLSGMYLDLADYYFNKRNYEQVSSSINRGLAYEPTSIQLLGKKKKIQTINSRVQAFEIEEQKSFDEDLKKYLKNCWGIDGFRNKQGEDIEYDKTFKIMAYDNKEVTYEINGKVQTGKYSTRPKGKLLYLTPDSNKDDYIVYKIIDISQAYLVLMPFKNDKLTGEKIYMAVCSQ